MKKILFLILIGLALVGCADPSTNDFTQFDTYFTGLTDDSKPYTILANQTAIIYTQAATSGSDSFTFTLSKSGSGYEANATMGRAAGEFNSSMWDMLSITTDIADYEIRNPAASVGDENGQYTFTIVGDYTSSIDDLTRNTTSIEAVFNGTEGKVPYQLSDKFIAAIKNYF